MKWGDLAVLAAWRIAALAIATRRFSWLPQSRSSREGGLDDLRRRGPSRDQTPAYSRVEQPSRSGVYWNPPGPAARLDDDHH